MENTENNLQINSTVCESFIEISKWTKFLSILGYVSLVFMALGSIMFILGDIGDGPSVIGETEITSSANHFEVSRSFNPTIMGILYAVLTVVYFIPIRALYRFSEQIKNAMYSRFQGDFDQAILNLKTHYKFLGIMAIVGISFSIVMVILLLLIATFVGGH